MLQSIDFLKDSDTDTNPSSTALRMFVSASGVLSMVDSD